MSAPAGSTVLTFAPPPPHWRLFRDEGQNVYVPAPKPPASQTYVAFGAERSLEVDVPVLDAEETLYDADNDLGEELINLHGRLQQSAVGLLRCILNDPGEHDRHLREIDNLVRNFVSIFATLRTREAQLLVLQRLTTQTSRKRKLLEEIQNALPRLRAQVGNETADDADVIEKENVSEEKPKPSPGISGGEEEMEEEEEDEGEGVASVAVPSKVKKWKKKKKRLRRT